MKKVRHKKVILASLIILFMFFSLKPKNESENNIIDESLICIISELQNIGKEIHLICKDILTPEHIYLGNFFPEHIEEMRIDYGNLQFEIKSENIKNEIIQTLKNVELFEDHLWIMGAGIPSLILTVIGDGKVVEFNEFIVTLDISVNGQNCLNGSYGYYPKGYKQEEVVEYLYSTYLKTVFNPYLESVDPHKIYYRKEAEDAGWIYPVYVETEDVIARCNMEAMGKDMYTLFNYESVKDFDFKKEGYTAYENEVEITELSSEYGTHLIYLKRNEDLFVLPYYCEMEKWGK